MNLQDQPAGELLRVEPARHDDPRQLDEVARVPCIGILAAAEDGFDLSRASRCVSSLLHTGMDCRLA